MYITSLVARYAVMPQAYFHSIADRHLRYRCLILVLLLSSILLPGTHAQSETSKPNIGTVNVDFDKAVLSPGLWHLVGHAKITSDDYDLVAADIKVTFAPSSKPGVSGLREAVAAGGDTQVAAHIRQPLQSTSYEVHSDRAVFLPDTGRPGGGTLKFTGHVKVITKSGFFAAPSVSTTDTATILLGVGADYPQVETGPGHITLTPAQ